MHRLYEFFVEMSNARVHGDADNHNYSAGAVCIGWASARGETTPHIPHHPDGKRFRLAAVLDAGAANKWGGLAVDGEFPAIRPPEVGAVV
jgi:hypothetical protein